MTAAIAPAPAPAGRAPVRAASTQATQAAASPVSPAAANATATSSSEMFTTTIATTAPTSDFSAALRDFNHLRTASLGTQGGSSANASVASSTASESVRETPVMAPADCHAVKQEVPLLDDVGAGAGAGAEDEDEWLPARVSKGDAQAIRDILLGNVKSPNHVSAGVGQGGWMKLVPEWEGAGRTEARRGSL